jgi:prevent-host-death family protein
MQRHVVSSARAKLASLLDDVEGGDEVIILRRDRPVARLVGIERDMTPFVSRAALRAQLPPMRQRADDDVREAREAERW